MFKKCVLGKYLHLNSEASLERKFLERMFYQWRKRKMFHAWRDECWVMPRNVEVTKVEKQTCRIHVSKIETDISQPGWMAAEEVWSERTGMQTWEAHAVRHSRNRASFHCILLGQNPIRQSLYQQKENQECFQWLYIFVIFSIPIVVFPIWMSFSL